MLLTDFRFAVELDNRRLGAFVECTLPTLQWDTQKIEEGGVNNYVHQLPTRRKEATIKLRRGLGFGRELMDWYTDSLAGNFRRCKVSIHLVQTVKKGRSYRVQDVITWTAENAFPIRWEGPPLKSEGKAVAIETLELSCGEVSMEYEEAYFPDSERWWLQRMENSG